MKNELNLGIGFVTGRKNACNIINAYYKDMLAQVEKYKKKVNITIFVLYDLTYQNAVEEDFYNINPEIYKHNINMRYITPKDIEEEKHFMVNNKILTNKEVALFFGNGHARGRNTLMHFAFKEKMDNLLFWDDDEYPIAVEKEANGNLVWTKQNNVLEHLKHLEKADVTIGYHCGYISPIPYIDYQKEIEEEILQNYIESISNDIINWENIKERFTKDNGVTFAKKELVKGKGAFEIQTERGGKWVAGSTLALNLSKIDKIPSFYNPPGARGEDTFFSTRLNESVVMKVPVYHFHDGFLKYQSIMKNKLPEHLRKIMKNNDEKIEERFLNASRGWIKYKPLYTYITNKENYASIMENVEKKLLESIPEMTEIFDYYDFNVVLDDFRFYRDRVRRDYNQYVKTNDVWNKIKAYLCETVKI